MNNPPATLTRGTLPCTGRALAYSVPYQTINLFTNSMKIFIHISIRETKNLQIVLLKIGSPDGIACYSLLFIMLRSIHFYNQLCFCTIKICDIRTQYFLPIKTNRIIFQKIIPQMTFFFCQSFSQHFSSRSNLFIVFSIHVFSAYFSSTTVTPCSPSPKAPRRKPLT